MKAAWEAKAVGDVCSIVGGGTPSRSTAAFYGGEIPWATIRDMKADWIETTEFSITPTAVKSSATNVLPAGTLIVASRVGLGKVCRLRRATAINQDLRGFIPKSAKQLDRQYLFLWFKSVADKIVAAGTGATVQGVTLPFLRSLQIPLPPLEEQRRIVAVLDDAFAAIATATANAEKNLANARELFDASVRDTFADLDPSWELMTLKEAARDFGRGRSKHRPRNDPKLYGGDYPFIQTGDVRNSDHLIKEYLQTYSEAGLAQSKLWPRGTICITIAANIAETGILDFDACFPDSVIGMVVDPARTSNSYVEYLLQSLKGVLQAKGKGSAQANINLATFENERFPFPPKDVQMEIVARLGALSEHVQSMETLYAQKLITLDALKQTILRRAFAGELATAVLAAAANDNRKTPAFTAYVIALAYRRHLASGKEATFGRVKAQKALHLCESVGGVDLGRNPVKDAAGPNDFQHMLAAEEWAKTNKFFEFVQRPAGNGYTFRKLSSFNEMVAEGAEALKPVQDRLESAIGLIAPMNSEQAELLATVHAAWNNLLLDGVDPTDAAIIHEARENWHIAKLKFGEGKFRQAIVTIRAKGMEPDGSAKRVGGQEVLLF